MAFFNIVNFLKFFRDRRIALPTGQFVFKHDVLLLLAEVICQRCIDAGIRPNVENAGNCARNCNCGVFGPRFRWRRSRCLQLEPDNPRLFEFNAFDANSSDPIDRFLDFLTESGAQDTKTIVLAHAGGR